MNIRRYPGTKPFERQEHELFFGRDTDIEKMLELMSFEPLLLLYSKSGLGKSSLINAGIIPELENQKEVDNQIFTLRFTKYGLDVPKPVENIVSRIKQTDARRSLLDKILPNQNSLWYHLKKRQLENEQDTHFYLFFDQFEEIFSYPEEQILDFKQQLKELLYVKLPQKIRDELDLMLEIDNEFLQAAELEKIYKPLTIRVVMAIRSDRMSLLNQIADYLPNILKVFYELTPLDRERAKKAIIEPASIAENSNFSFESPIFAFDELLLKRILDYLTENNTKSIETFQLQMICQQAENIALAKQKQPIKGDLVIQNDDMGELKSIFAAHYAKSLKLFGNQQQQHPIRRLIEEKLIIENSRMSLPDKALLREEGITENVLRQLLESRLLRSEPNNTGGVSYEISHDTLVAPILEAKKVREEAEEEARAKAEQVEKLRQAEQAAERERTEREKERKRQRKVILMVGSVAVVAILLAIFSLFQMQIANTATQQAKQAKTQAEKQTILAEEKEEEAQARLEDFYKAEIQKNMQIAKDMIELKEFEVALKYLKKAKSYNLKNDELELLINKCKQNLWLNYPKSTESAKYMSVGHRPTTKKCKYR